MRCKYGPKKLRRLNREFGWLVGQPIVAALTRGNTGHSIDLCLEDRTIVTYSPNTGKAYVSLAKYGHGTRDYTDFLVAPKHQF